VTFFVLLVVGVVVAQTWMDWSDESLEWSIPDWAKGLGLASVLTISLTAGTSFAAYCYEVSVSQGGSGISSWLWLELGFLVCGLGVVLAAVRRRRIRTLLILSAIFTVFLWIGLALTS
jgi:hypothetical protein